MRTGMVLDLRRVFLPSSLQKRAYSLSSHCSILELKVCQSSSLRISLHEYTPFSSNLVSGWLRRGQRASPIGVVILLILILWFIVFVSPLTEEIIRLLQQLRVEIPKVRKTRNRSAV